MNASASTGNMQYVALPANVPNNAILVLQNNQLIVQPPNSASPTPAPAEAPHRAIVPAAPAVPFLVEVPVGAGAIPGRVDEGEDGAAGPGNATDLNVLHACLHCRTAKTACTDQRPCNRCTRLGLDCVSYREEPRKRACTGCHSAKVSCDLGVLGGDTCTRCRRLGTPCIPRTTGSMRGCVRKRKRPADDGGGAGGYGLPLGEGTAAAAAAGLLLPMSHSPAPSPTPSNMVSVAVSLLGLSQDTDSGDGGGARSRSHTIEPGPAAHTAEAVRAAAAAAAAAHTAAGVAALADAAAGRHARAAPPPLPHAPEKDSALLAGAAAGHVASTNSILSSGLALLGSAMLQQ